ncbi:SMI1/KNR4 family protein [Myroides sp. BIT-d1]|uniref:SMI1/KNR4 family protein n=1 Tax=Myroides albus TaxID=2562892 RepID=A0A6I3LMY5_9FLAO|nr:SMI1/KNR4 family protein [Myroides albus]MVX36196.1 SMI1/KNR4 family protein [Myroides sp. LoEW2-1]
MYKEKLTRTYTLLENSLKDVFIVQHLNKFKIVYVFEINNEVLIYEGNEPITESDFLKNLPEDIRAYYMNVHNGWYESLSGGLGFLPLDKIEFLDESEWGILEEIKTLDIDLSKTYYLFHNAGAGYLCVDIEKSVDEAKYLIWWTNKEPKYDIDFWSFLDAWIEIGLTN